MKGFSLLGEFVVISGCPLISGSALTLTASRASINAMRSTPRLALDEGSDSSSSDPNVFQHLGD